MSGLGVQGLGSKEIEPPERAETICPPSAHHSR